MSQKSAAKPQSSWPSGHGTVWELAPALGTEKTPYKLGHDIRDARRRRRIPVLILAERASIGLTTLNRIEKGDPNASLGNYAAVLFVLGMVDRPADIADARGDPKDRLNQLVKLVKEKGIALAYSSDIAPAHGLSSGGKITLLPDLPAAKHFAVLVHELSTMVGLERHCSGGPFESSFAGIVREFDPGRKEKFSASY